MESKDSRLAVILHTLESKEAYSSFGFWAVTIYGFLE